MTRRYLLCELFILFIRVSERHAKLRLEIDRSNGHSRATVRFSQALMLLDRSKERGTDPLKTKRRCTEAIRSLSNATVLSKFKSRQPPTANR